MFGRPTPKGWFEVEVRPSYNNARKLKRVLDTMFKPGEYRVQSYRDRWIIMTSRKITDDELKEINRPRAEAMATPKPKAKPNLKTWMDIFGGLGFWRHAAKDKGRGVAVKAASTTVLEDCTDVDNDASTTVAGPSTARDGSGSI